ncbi:MAG: hypothetical protein MZW92_71560, partial [Comamonadaceae bacterium]|nr:hypothetical protein [Comamonadaceae bacterium]
FVQLRIAKVKQTTTNGIDSTWPALLRHEDGSRIHREGSRGRTGLPAVIQPTQIYGPENYARTAKPIELIKSGRMIYPNKGRRLPPA